MGRKMFMKTRNIAKKYGSKVALVAGTSFATLPAFATGTAPDWVATSLGAAKDDMLASIAAAAPLVLLVVSAVAVLFLVIRIFKRGAK